MNDFQFLIDYFNGEPFIIQLVWVAIFVLFLIVIILIIYLKLLRNHLRENERIVLKYSKKNELLLITFLYAEVEDGGISSEQEIVINKLKRGIKNTFKREIIISTLLKLKNEISGEMAESIQNLYFQINLKSYALVKLKNKKWYIIAKGIRELTLFQVKEAHDEVLKHIDHPKKEVRKEVQLYLVNLFNFEGLIFLNQLKTQLSEWDQIQLLEELQKFENQEIPDITSWLKSTNDSVVIFALKLAKIYNKFEMKDVLIDLIKHKSEKVRLELIPVLSYLQVDDAKGVLKHTFNESSKYEKIEFFKLLENLADDNDELFIIEHIHHENFEIKFSALKTLKNINNNKFNNLEIKPSDIAYSKIVKFLKNN
tara:strand:+ start:20554 stop:21657 length:1104 start_codon:yes stop_codon:yes gene_type:complete